MNTNEKSDLIKSLKAKHKDLIEVPLPSDPSVFVIARRAGKDDWLKRKQDARHPVYKNSVDERFAKRCIVHPSTAVDAQAIFNAYGFFARTVALEISLFSGASLEHDRAFELDPEEHADLFEKYGTNIRGVMVPDEPDLFVAFKLADKQVALSRRVDINNEVPTEVVDEKLCQVCTVYPDNFQTILDKYPFFIDELAGEIMLFAGGVLSANIRKKH